MKCGLIFRRLLLLAAVSAISLAGSSLAHAASSSTASQARQLGAGCEPNGLPNSLAVCEGTGRLNVRLTGTAVLSVQSGRVTLKGKAERVCRMKRVKRKNGNVVNRRVCTKRAKPLLPKNVVKRQARGYTIYIGERLYFYLPPGKWRVSAEGQGLSLSAVGEGLAGVKSRMPRDGSVPQSGLISIGGELYNDWPRRWTKYEFGPKVAQETTNDTPASQPATRTRSAPAPLVTAVAPAKPASLDGQAGGLTKTDVIKQAIGDKKAAESNGAEDGPIALQLRRSAAE